MLTWAANEKGNRNRVLHLGDELDKVAALREDMALLEAATDNQRKASRAKFRKVPSARASAGKKGAAIDGLGRVP